MAEFGSLAPGVDWADQEAQAGLPFVVKKEEADKSAKRSWYDTINDVAHFPHRMFGALADPGPMSPEAQASADQAAMSPETYINPLVKNIGDTVGAAIKSGFTAPHDALAGTLPIMDESGHPTEEAVRRVMDTAALATGASVAGTAGRAIPAGAGADIRIFGKRIGSAPESVPAAAPSELAAPYHEVLASDTGKPGGMIANADQLKELANQRRARGWATGKPAEGWEFRRPGPEAGSLDEAMAKGAAAQQAERAAAEPASPLLSPDDHAFIQGGGFYSDTGKPGAAIAAAQHAPTFYSGLERAVSAAPQDAMTGAQWLGTLANRGGVKAEELDWTGLKDLLSARPGENKPREFTKQELLDHLDKNAVKVNEVNKGELEFNSKSPYALPEVIRAAKEAGDNPGELELVLANDGNAYRALTKKFPELSGDEDWAAKVAREVFGGDTMPSGTTKYHGYQLPGGVNYREKLLTLPVSPLKGEYTMSVGEGPHPYVEGARHRFIEVKKPDGSVQASWTDSPQARKDAQAFVDRLNKGTDPVLRDDLYKSQHWDEPNVLAHLRMNDREMAIPQTAEDLAAAEKYNKAQVGIDANRKSQGEIGRQIRLKAAGLEEARRGAIASARDRGEISVAEAAKRMQEYGDFPELKPLQDKLQALRAKEDELRTAAPAPMPRSAKTLHLEELQSDWHQAGRKQGYKTDAPALSADEASEMRALEKKYGDSNLSMSEFRRLDELRAKNDAAEAGDVPNAPFKKNWHELGLKRALREAAEGGYDRLSWTPGEAQAARYDLSKQIKSLKATPIVDQHGAISYEIRAQGHPGTQDFTDVVKEDALPNAVGKEMAQKIIDKTERKTPKTFTGLDLKVGGEGMKGFYDKIVPDYLNKFGKQFGAQVKEGQFSSGSKKLVPYIEITPAMREHLLTKGMPLFEDSTPGQAVSAASHAQDLAKPYHELLEKPAGGAYGAPHETAPHATTESAAPGKSGRAAGVDERAGLGGSPSGGDGLQQAQLQARRRAGGREPLPGLPTGAQLVNGEPFVPGPVARAHEVADRYMADKDFGRYFQHPEKYHPLDPEHSTAIAKAFEEMKHTPNDPATKASYDALIKETRDQYRAIRESGLRLTPTDATTYPYHGNPRAVAQDVADNNHMAFFKTDAGFGSDPGSKINLKRHPMMQPSGETLNGEPLLNNDLFRIVHDYFGHVKNGYGFRATGEDNAWRAHAAMYSDLARPAMTTETRGQNSWVNYGPHGEKNRTASGADTIYADQKVGLMPEWTMRDRNAPAPVIAYHGSPHTFDKFDPSKLGTGEGAQVYGKGLYFAEEPKVAKMYRDQLAQRHAWEQDGKPIPAWHVDDALLSAAQKAEVKVPVENWHPDRVPQMVSDVSTLMADGKTPAQIRKSYDVPAGYEKAWDAILNEAEKFRFNKQPGSSYEVAIDHPPERFLDWDKPFKHQHPDIQNATRSALEARLAAMHEGRAHFERKAAAGDRSAQRYISTKPPPPQTIENFKGHEIHQMLGLPAKDQEEAFTTSAQRLKEAGIPGIRYFDEKSRPAAAKVEEIQRELDMARGGWSHTPKQIEKLRERLAAAQAKPMTRNYVTFDAPRILKRYAIPGAVGATGFGSLSGGQEQQ